MMTFQQEPGTNLIELTVDGKVTREEFDRLRVAIEKIIEEHGKVRMLEVIRDLGAMEPSAIWEDLKFGPSHMKDFSRVGVVANQKWITWFTSLAKPFLSAEVQCFKLEELEQARAWLRQPVPTGQ